MSKTDYDHDHDGIHKETDREEQREGLYLWFVAGSGLGGKPPSSAALTAASLGATREFRFSELPEGYVLQYSFSESSCY